MPPSAESLGDSLQEFKIMLNKVAFIFTILTVTGVSIYAISRARKRIFTT